MNDSNGGLPAKRMKSCLLLLALVFLVLPARTQQELVLIHIRLIDGRTGNPMKNQRVGLEDRVGYPDISVRTNKSGIASLNISRDAVILAHNTDDYVNCGDERGGLVHNDFKVSQIISVGIVRPSSSQISAAKLLPLQNQEN